MARLTDPSSLVPGSDPRTGPEATTEAELSDSATVAS